MEAAKKEAVVLYPAPNLGHLIPMVELGKLLISYSPSLSLNILCPTLSSTSSLASYVSSACPSISFHSLPPICPLSGDPTHFENFPLNNPAIRDFLRSLSLSSHVSAFILDSFCYAALDVSQSLHIRSFFFYTSGASALALILNVPVFDKLATGSFLNLGATPFQIPGLFSVPANHMPEPMLNRGLTYNEYVKRCATLPKADGIIVNTFESLEHRAVKGLKEGTCLPRTLIPPVYPIGPLIASHDSEGEGESSECLSWLDSQPSRSVVYLGFGSKGLFSQKQLREIANGLERSGVKFLWVVRAPPIEDKAKQVSPIPEPNLDSLLPSGFLDRTRGRGFVAKSWVPQTDILRHEAIGCFVTHCGWNSTLEAVCAGVPLVAWPLYAEQRFNKILLVEEIKIALPMDELEDHFVSSIEIEKRVKQILNSKEGEAIMKRMLELSVAAKAAFNEGGSSKVELVNLVESWKY